MISGLDPGPDVMRLAWYDSYSGDESYDMNEDLHKLVLWDI